jgi:hypothetical protein
VVTQPRRLSFLDLVRDSGEGRMSLVKTMAIGGRSQ